MNEKPPIVEGYEILGQLGQGGMSAVWKARQVLLGRIVVIKVLSEKMTHNPDDIRYFQREALIAANLKHPGIVHVYDFGKFKEAPGYYFIMEYISGYTVGAWLRRKGKLDEADVLVIAHSVADALRYAWDQDRVIHCDIKPDNIMVDGDGTIKLTDLGVARAISTIGMPAQTADDAIYVMGTPNYMAPEQVRGDKNLDCRADIYGLGATLHHLLTGCLPFGADDPRTIMARQVREPFDDPRKLNPALSAGGAGLVMKMLAKHPAARYQNWGEVLGDIVRLEQLVRRQPSKPESSASTIPLQIVKDLLAKPAAPGSRRAVPLADTGDLQPCPYCSEPIRLRAVYCRFCGKQVPRAAGLAAGPQPKTQRRVRSQAKVAASNPAPSLAPLPSLKLKQSVGFWGYVRVGLSLGLIVLLAYYAYNRFVKHVNIMTPISMALRQRFRPEEFIRHWRDNLRALNADAENKAGPPEDARRPARVPEPAPAISAAPPAETDQQIMQSAKYRQLLKNCERRRPAIGSSITIQLNPPSAPMRGILVDYRDEHLLLQLPSGTVAVRYRDMEASTRQFYCAREHALRLYREQAR